MKRSASVGKHRDGGMTTRRPQVVTGATGGQQKNQHHQECAPHGAGYGVNAASCIFPCNIDALLALMSCI